MPIEPTERPEDDDDGKSEGEGDFGRPELKPNLEALFDPASVIAEGSPEGEERAGALPPGVELFGQWELRESSLMLFHRQRKKRLMLERLNAPSEMMRVVVALATQAGPQGQWDIENLLRALDAATQRKFSKGLYQIASMSNDTAKLDWRQGTLSIVEPLRPHSSF
jgi:hypothetical protein